MNQLFKIATMLQGPRARGLKYIKKTFNDHWQQGSINGPTRHVLCADGAEDAADAGVAAVRVLPLLPLAAPAALHPARQAEAAGAGPPRRRALAAVAPVHVGEALARPATSRSIPHILS